MFPQPHGEKIIFLEFSGFGMQIEADKVQCLHHDCQTHANLNHVPPSELCNMTSPWPFSVWGIDVIGRIASKASNGHEYILVAIDYFTKWVEVASYSMLKAKHVAWFI